MDKSICQRIREVRKSLKLTQNQFAELVDLSEDSIGKIERGTVPRMETVYKIANGLNMSVEDLLGKSKKSSAKLSSKVLNDFVVYLNTRSAEDIKFIHELAVKIFERQK